jgi:threonyl-tRNA synthetase
MKNEHRKIANEQKLFNLSDYSSGMVMWLPKGQSIYQSIESYLREIQNEYNYQEVKSPIIANSDLWQKSGHLDNFKDNMFFVNNEENDKEVAIKPMNCPFHIDIFKQMNYSYRDLPVRMSEFGLCHRNEASGALNGLFRLRSFNQDDGHIFCRKEQIESELILFVEMLYKIYKKFGFNKDNISIKLALRPENKIGDDELWDLAENYLKKALNDLNIDFEELKGEGAFYGPKIEFGLKDSLNREWQCGVFQLDFLLSKRLDSSFINESGDKEYPIILHRAALGSLERFIAILLEHYEGKLPLWLNPHAISILPISEEQHDYAEKIKKELDLLGIASFIDYSDKKIGYKIKKSFKDKCSYMFILGNKEKEELKVSIKSKKENKSLDLKDLKQFLKPFLD